MPTTGLPRLEGGYSLIAVAIRPERENRRFFTRYIEKLRKGTGWLTTHAARPNSQLVDEEEEEEAIAVNTCRGWRDDDDTWVLPPSFF